MSRFMRVRGEVCGEYMGYVINVDKVSWICADLRTVCMSSSSILWLCPEDIQRLLSMTGVDHDAD